MKSLNSKNTINWQRSLDKRNTLIARAEYLHLILDSPHNMKLIELESLIENAERWRVV